MKAESSRSRHVIELSGFCGQIVGAMAGPDVVVGGATVEQTRNVGVIERGQDLALTPKPLKDVVGI